MKIMKLKVVKLDNYNYIFEDIYHNNIELYVSFYGCDVNIGNYLLIDEKIIKEHVPLNFEVTDEDCTIKLVKENNCINLKRIYG